MWLGREGPRALGVLVWKWPGILEVDGKPPNPSHFQALEVLEQDPEDAVLVRK